MGRNTQRRRMVPVQTSPRMSPFPSESNPKTMTFASCLEKLLGGEKVHRLAWEEDPSYLVIKDERLMIYRPDTKNLHPLIVSVGDIVGTDWEVVPTIIVQEAPKNEPAGNSDGKIQEGEIEEPVGEENNEQGTSDRSGDV